MRRVIPLFALGIVALSGCGGSSSDGSVPAPQRLVASENRLATDPSFAPKFVRVYGGGQDTQVIVTDYDPDGTKPAKYHELNLYFDGRLSGTISTFDMFVYDSGVGYIRLTEGPYRGTITVTPSGAKTHVMLHGVGFQTTPVTTPDRQFALDGSFDFTPQ